MKTMSLGLDEDVDAALEALSPAQEREKGDRVRQIVCRFRAASLFLSVNDGVR